MNIMHSMASFKNVSVNNSTPQRKHVSFAGLETLAQLNALDKMDEVNVQPDLKTQLLDLFKKASTRASIIGNNSAEKTLDIIVKTLEYKPKTD